MVLPGVTRIPGEWLEGGRVGLVGHPASRAEGVHSAVWLRERGVRLAALFGPEHGFFGRGGAGEEVGEGWHEEWGIPIHSLYGETRKPTAEMLAGVDVVVYDLQGIACRAYTYTSTLRLVMEACAEEGKRLVVADRPDALMNCGEDGPMLEEKWRSFVGLVPVPFCFGRTAGELALLLKERLGLAGLDLRVAACGGLRRGMAPEEMFAGEWRAPSPAIGDVQAALCFPLNVQWEALPAVDHARGTPEAFRCIGSDQWDLWALAAPEEEGLEAVRCEFKAKDGRQLRGWRFTVTDSRRYRPARAAWRWWQAVAKVAGGEERLWETEGARREWWHKLWGAERVGTVQWGWGGGGRIY